MNVWVISDGYGWDAVCDSEAKAKEHPKVKSKESWIEKVVVNKW